VTVYANFANFLKIFADRNFVRIIFADYFLRTFA